MFKNYIKVTIRNYWKNRIYTLINILGLSIGLACFIGIMAYTNNELSYDRHHENSENIYRIKLIGEMSGTSFEAAVCGGPVGEIIHREVPEVDMFSRFIQLPRAVLFNYNENKIYQEGILYADSSFLKMFTYNVIGDVNIALQEPYSLVLLESIAKKYFGNENPIGKIIKWDNKVDYTVTAIIKEPLQNSHIGFDVLVSRASLYSNPRYERLFNNLFAFTNLNYIKTNTKNISDLESKINEVFQKHVGDALKESGSKLELKLQPITDIHLKSNITHEIKQNGNITTVYIFIVIAILIIVISSINYINLSIANLSTRQLEIGIRRIFGAKKTSLFNQFLADSVFLVIVSFILGLLILKLIAPLFNSISNYPFDYILKNNINWLIIIIFIPVISLMAGLYPALYLSSLKPIRILKGNRKSGKERNLFRNTMIVIQFVISIFLLSSTWLIKIQLDFINDKDLGFSKENVIVMSLRNSDMRSKFPSFKNELLNITGVSDVSASSSRIGGFNQRRGFYRDGFTRKDMMMILNLQCEDNFLEIMNIEILEGRHFLTDSQGDENKIIVNETLVHEFGIKNPIGKSFRLPIGKTEPEDLKLEIIGVCKDFHYASLHNKVKPIIIWKDKTLRRFASIKLNSTHSKNTLDAISKKWSEIYPDYPFEYFFLDEKYESQYKSDINVNRIFFIFTLIAIVIACLGVYGLTAYSTQKRTKEIGIRKVLGASVNRIMFLISKDYFMSILISSVISAPASWYFINNWLQNFAYSAAIKWFVFVTTPFIALLIALIATNIITFIAARKNPVDSIRYE